MRFSLAFAAAFVFASPLRAAPPVSVETDPVQAAIRDVLIQEGFPVDAAGVAIINEGSQLSVTIDLSRGLTSYLAGRIAERLAVERPELAGVKVDMKVFGTAEKTTANEAPVPSTNWRDALSSEPKSAETALALSVGGERPHPEDRANLVIAETDEAGRMIILRHLKEIEESGRMSESIATDAYWRDVFSKMGYGDVYEPSRETLKSALRAGLKPYKAGKGLNAKIFAQLAMKALEPAPVAQAEPVQLVHP